MEGLELVSSLRYVQASTKCDHAYYDSIVHCFHTFDLGSHITSKGRDGGWILDAVRGAIGNLFILTYQMFC